MATDTQASRLTKMEGVVSGLSQQFADFLKESKEHRDRTERDNQQIWQAIKEQGAAMQASVDRLSSKGEMSWGKIASVGGFMFVCASGLGALVWQLSEARVHQLEVKADTVEKYNQEIRTLEKEVRDTHDKFLLRICDENHENIRRLTDK